MKLKLVLSVCLAALCLGMQAKDYKYQTVSGDLMNTRIYTLDNGLKVYLSVNKEKPRIQTYIAVRTGSRNDPSETTGLAHYLEHIMFKGTNHFGTSDAAKEAVLLDQIEKKYEVYRKMTDPQERKECYHEIDSLSQLAAKYFIPNEYDKLMSAIGAKGTNAYTSNDVTCYVEDIPSNEVENWLKVEGDRFQNMVIRGFHTELEAVYEEFNIGLSNDSRKVHTALFNLLCPNHPYGTQTTIGTQEHLKNPSIVNIKNYFNRYYVPNNTAICMAGDMNPDEVIELIDKYFGSWKASENLSRPEYPELSPITEVKDTTVIGKEAERLMLAWRFDKSASMQADTLDVISNILANGKAGLFEINLEQKMLAQGVGAFNYGLTDYSGLVISGTPKDNQDLKELRELIIGEIGKLKRGEFSDDLIPSVINNMKLNYYKSLQNNDSRADMFVNAFINGKKWEDVVNRLDRISGITKQQIVDFANKHLNDNYVCVYKRTGDDNTVKKIDKPQITPIPSNRDMSSDFLNEIVNTKTKPIEPRFLDFKKDLAVTTTKNKLPMLYKQNTDDGLFSLTFYYDFGTEAMKEMSMLPDYLYYLGTNKKTSSQIKQDFYKLACNYSMNVGSNSISINLNGLSENMPQALALLEDFINNAKGDKETYDKYVNLVIKARQDAKKNQRANFSALNTYGMYGPYNHVRNIMSEQELRESNSDTMTDLLKKLNGIEHTVLYYGPYSEKEIAATIAKYHKTAKKLAGVPQGKEYTAQETPENEVIIAPYDAKNIYMMQYHNENRPWNPDEAAVQNLFNEYFGGSMNGVVFQELREARGLAYSASARYSQPWRKNQYESFYTYIISQNDKMMDCIKVFNNILDTIPQSQAAFDIAKQSLQKSLESRRVTRASVLYAYLNAKRLGLDYDINEKIYNTLPRLTLNDIVKFERDNMANKTFRYIILGNEKELDTKALEQIAPIKHLSTEEIFGY